MRKKHLFTLLALALAALQPAMGQTGTKYPLEGNGTEEFPYIIDGATALRFIQMRMLERSDFADGKHFLLTADIRLNGGPVLGDGATGPLADTTRLERWTPIGTKEDGLGYTRFCGIFDGNGHTISGMYVNSPTVECQGLFRSVGRGGVVRNLRVADSFVRGYGVVGAICGECNNGEITDCEAAAMVVGYGATHQGGGICGIVSGDGRLLRCVNRGPVEGVSVPDDWGEMWNCSTGGICGSVSSAVVDSCENHGTVSACGWGPAGGVTGSAGGRVRWCANHGRVTSDCDASLGGIAGSNSNYIADCTNYGRPEPQAKGTCAGGIVGTMSWNSRVYGSANMADIATDVDSVFVGGIVGYMDGGINYGTYYTPMVYSSSNHGNLLTTGALSQAGGISGKNYCAEIHGCGNHAAVRSATLAGGMSPQCEFHSNISGCCNTGLVSGGAYAGGIVGDTNGSVDDSWNSGPVGGEDGSYVAGGIAGYSSSGISRCFNTGTVSRGRRAAGIAGDGNQKMYISSCYNAGHILSDRAEAIVAGVSGGSGTVSNCYNTGAVEATGDGSTLGGVAYNTWVHFDSHGNRSGSTAENCYNMGPLRALGAGCRVGNITGSYVPGDAYLLFKNCYYLRNAVEGGGYTTDDDLCDSFTALEEDAFRTLADKLNVREWWDENDIFVQGYYRPVLVGGGMHYTVATQEGDSVRLDLGRPSDNTVFRTDTTGMVLEAYNVLHSDTVRRAMLVDGRDFRAPSPFVARSLTYSCRPESVPGLMCLPFAVGQADVPEGALLMHTVGIEENGTVLPDTVASVAAGVPFMLSLPEGTAEWSLEKRDADVAAVPVADGYMTGTFTLMRELSECDYVPTETAGLYRRAVAADSLTAFRACLHADGLSVPELTLVTAATGIRAAEADCRLSVEGRTVTVEALPGTPVRMYSAGGTTEYAFRAGQAPATMSAAPGIHFVTVGTRTHKVLLR